MLITEAMDIGLGVGTCNGTELQLGIGAAITRGAGNR
jgi:hypothetical protein